MIFLTFDRDVFLNTDAMRLNTPDMSQAGKISLNFAIATAMYF